ncbi:MAG TPA: 4-hydroxy-tetrahydrodipicolinate synthase [Fulvivirga sp.]|nr:4-hydroxy-tetrahydrodipicolinate synthase [Fulvivirga sp.]
MEIERLYGTGVALVTPFNKDESIDYVGLKNLLNTTAKKGVDYYVVQGTTGESVTTTAKEKAELLQFVKENNPQKLPIVYGIGGNNTQNVLEAIKESNLTGVDALLSVSPYYNKPSQAGIIKHFEKIADASPVPVILYNVPGRTASNLTAKTTLALARHQNIIGVKEASGNVEQAMEISASMPKDFLLISGDDMLTVPLYSIGAKGVISVLANAFADVFKNIKGFAFEGNYEKASKEAFKLLKINPLMYVESNPVGIKYVLELQKVCCDFVRLPLLQASSELKEQIRKSI